MSVPKRHHYIAQMILRRFTDQRGLLYCHSRTDRHQSAWSSKPANVFAENHLYNVSIEKEFSALEGRVAVMIDEFVEAALCRRNPQLGLEDRDVWFQFLVLQQRRVPDVARPVVEANVDCLIEEIPAKIENDIGRRLTSNEIAAFRKPDNQERLRKNAVAFFASAKPRRDFLNRLHGTSIETALIGNPRKSFVCGSRPIAGFHEWFCVHQKVAVKLLPLSGLDQLVIFNSSSEIRRINHDIVNRSTFFAGPSRSLVESLARPR